MRGAVTLGTIIRGNTCPRCELLRAFEIATLSFIFIILLDKSADRRLMKEAIDRPSQRWSFFRSMLHVAVKFYIEPIIWVIIIINAYVHEDVIIIIIFWRSHIAASIELCRCQFYGKIGWTHNAWHQFMHFVYLVKKWWTLCNDLSLASRWSNCNVRLFIVSHNIELSARPQRWIRRQNATLGWSYNRHDNKVGSLRGWRDLPISFLVLKMQRFHFSNILLQLETASAGNIVCVHNTRKVL